ncbi:hypothetical protein NMY22_g12248 [Coprinellus aureogranulatus]|nr:hypothetical protein NMY22_g12248 [Coprinellus aureogranulatus]
MAIRNLLRFEWHALGCYIYWRRRWFIEFLGGESSPDSDSTRRYVKLFLADVESTIVLQGYQALSGITRPFPGQASALWVLGQSDKAVWDALQSGELLEDIPFAMLPFRFPQKQWWIEGLDPPTANSIFDDFLGAWYSLLNNASVPDPLASGQTAQAVLKEIIQFMERETEMFGGIVHNYEMAVERVRRWGDKKEGL